MVCATVSLSAFASYWRAVCTKRCMLWMVCLQMLLTYSGGSLATSCVPMTRGFLVGRQVVFFEYDESAMGPKRQEHTLTHADPSTFEPLRQTKFERGPCAGRNVEFGRDKDHVYFRSEVVSGADPKTFTFMDEYYARDKSAIYANARRLTTRGASFRVIEGGYATDGRLHFYRDTVIRESGFEPLRGKDAGNTGYARTRNLVYHNGKVVPDADPQTFELFMTEVGMARDHRHVFFNDRLIAGADPATMVQIQGYAFKDRNSVYNEGRRIEGLSPARVRASEFGSYLMDDQRVFKNGIEIRGRDPSTFRELQPPWTLDKLGVYYGDQIVPEIDQSTFQATALDRGEDQNHRYQGPTKVCGFRQTSVQDLPVCP